MKHKIRLQEFEKFDTEVELALETDGDYSKRLTAYLFPISGYMHSKLYYDDDCKIRMNALDLIIEEYSETVLS